MPDTTGRLRRAEELARGALRVARAMVRAARRRLERAAAGDARPELGAGARPAPRMAAAAPRLRRRPVARPCAPSGAAGRPAARVAATGAPAGAPCPGGRSRSSRGRAARVPAWQAPLWDLDEDGAQLALMPDPRDVTDLTGTAWDGRPRLELVAAGAPGATAPGHADRGTGGEALDQPPTGYDTPDPATMHPQSGVSNHVETADTPDHGVTEPAESSPRHRGTGNVYSLGTRRAHTRHTSKEGT